MVWFELIVKFVLGLGVLVWSANCFITASKTLAYHYKVPKLLIGVLLIGFGTSCPELVVNMIASWQHLPDLAIGNVIGSNIANKALVGGAAAMIVPLTVHSKLLRREFPILLAATVLVGILFYSLSEFGHAAGIILLVFFCGYLIFMYKQSRRNHVAEDQMVQEFQHEEGEKIKTTQAAWVWWLVGLGLLLVSSDIMVNAATHMAELLHISELVIGITVVAIGTSLPELAATMVSVLRHEFDLAIGNVIGSSIFNILLVLAIPALLSPVKLKPIILHRDFPVMASFIFLFWLFANLPWCRGKITRSCGIILLLGYIAYLLLLAGVF